MPTTYEDPINAIKFALTPPSIFVQRPANLSQIPLADFLALFFEKLSRRTAELVLVLDQFEEFFTLSSAPAHKEEFLRALSQIYHDFAFPMRIVIAIRADYFEAYEP